MKIHFQKTLAVILMAVTIITSLSINTMAVYAAESNQITKADIANAIAQKRGLYCAPTFIQEFVVNLDEAVNYFNQKVQEQADWNDIAVATAQEIKDSTTLQEKIETIYDAAIAETKSVYTCFDAVFGTVKKAFSPEVKAELMKDGNGGFILNYATHDPSKSVNALGEYGLTKDDYFDYENSDSVAVYDEFVDAFSTDFETYIKEYNDYYLVTVPSYRDVALLSDATKYPVKTRYDAVQRWCASWNIGDIYNVVIDANGIVYNKKTSADYLFYKSSYLTMCDSNWVYSGNYPYYYGLNISGEVLIPYEFLNTPDAHKLTKTSSIRYYIPSSNITSEFDSETEYTTAIGNYVEQRFTIEPLMSKTGLCAKERTTVKIYKSIDAVKKSTTEKPNVYYSGDIYNSYDSSVDNSVTYNSGVNNGYIYTTIDNSVTTGMTEAEVQALIVSILENTNSGSGSGGSGDSGSGSGDSGDSGSGGSGIIDLIKGLGSLGDTLLSLIGNVIQIASGFIKQLGDIITGLTTGLQSACGQVGDLIASFFPFIPPEIISAITLGIVAIILIAVIKQIKG